MHKWYIKHVWKGLKMSYDCVLKCGKSCNSSDSISQGKWESLEKRPSSWTNFAMFITQYHGKMVRWVVICIRLVISHYHLRWSLYKHSNTKPKKQTFLRVSVMLLLRDYLCVKMKYSSHCHPSAYDHVGGPLHNKNKCVWCMQGVDTKHPDRAQ